ncbi:hypothetical protein IIA79_05040 [bacterium]|nr:hypothetical protein [bacterium]
MEPTKLERLSFIKYLFELAVDQSEQPEPACCVSILMFHDAVELFLQLAAEDFGVSQKKPSFMGYWEALEPKLCEGHPTQKESMRRMNKARVDLKHHGIRPSRLDIESMRGATQSFFVENTESIFDIPFTRLSLIELVGNEGARRLLWQAEELYGDGDSELAAGSVRAAFHLVMQEGYDRRSWFHPSSLQRAEMELQTFTDHAFRFSRGLSDVEEAVWEIQKLREHVFPHVINAIKELSAELSKLSDAVDVLAHGIDHRQYTRFLRITLNASVDEEGKIRLHEQRAEYRLTSDELSGCIRFVVECALKLQERSNLLKYRD